MFGGIWIRDQLIWWERKVIRETRSLWELYGFWDWVTALDYIEEKWLLGMIMDYWRVKIWGGKLVVTYEVDQIKIVA